MDPSRHSNLLGKPKEGVHSHRIFGLAAVDLGLTFLVAYVCAKWWGWSPWVTFVGLVLIGIGIHGFFGVDTELNSLLGLSKKHT